MTPREAMRERETIAPYPRRASHADILTDSLRRAGVDVTCMSPEQVLAVVAMYDEQCLKDVIARLSTQHAFAMMMRDAVAADEDQRWAGVVVGYEAAIEEVNRGV